MSNGKGDIREMTLVLALALLGVGVATVAAFTPWYEAVPAEIAIVGVQSPLPDPPDVMSRMSGAQVSGTETSGTQVSGTQVSGVRSPGR